MSHGWGASEPLKILRKKTTTKLTLTSHPKYLQICSETCKKHMFWCLQFGSMGSTKNCCSVSFVESKIFSPWYSLDMRFTPSNTVFFRAEVWDGILLFFPHSSTVPLGSKNVPLLRLHFVTISSKLTHLNCAVLLQWTLKERWEVYFVLKTSRSLQVVRSHASSRLVIPCLDRSPQKSLNLCSNPPHRTQGLFWTYTFLFLCC